MQGINVTSQAQEVLDFWFTPDPGQPADAMRTAWFKKDAAFDAKIDRTTIYLPPEEEKAQPVTRTYTRRVN